MCESKQVVSGVLVRGLDKEVVGTELQQMIDLAASYPNADAWDFTSYLLTVCYNTVLSNIWTLLYVTGFSLGTKCAVERRPGASVRLTAVAGGPRLI